MSSALLRCCLKACSSCLVRASPCRHGTHVRCDWDGQHQDANVRCNRDGKRQDAPRGSALLISCLQACSSCLLWRP